MPKVKRMKRSYIPLLAFLVLLLVGGGAYAAFLCSQSVPSHVKIIEVVPPPPPTYDIDFFEDSECQNPLTFIEYGDRERGSSAQKAFYTKNVGEVNVKIAGTSSLPSDVGTLTVQFKEGGNWVSAYNLDIGKKVETRAALDAKSDAPLGDCNFNIVVEASDQ